MKDTGRAFILVTGFTGGPSTHTAKFLVAFVLGLTATLAQAAGFRFTEVPADANGPVLKGAMWYPCSEAPDAIVLGPYSLSVAKDCPISGDKLPLIVISHGRGGSFLGHYDVAETLADAGFVVAAINHPGDTYFDMSRSDNLSAFVERPTDISRLLDHMLGAPPATPKIDSERIGFFGFSRGGYTGLVLIGANPDWAKASELCQQSSLHVCEQVRRKEFPAQPLAHDPRIRAAVVADPFGGLFFSAESLSAVKSPVQLWASEFGGDGVTQESVAAVNRNLVAKHEYHLVPNSGHFAFLICPPALAKMVPEICTDAPGFDRVALHKEFNSEVLAFFRNELRPVRHE
jgi:predicted dienelactone hydrolase